MTRITALDPTGSQPALRPIRCPHLAQQRAAEQLLWKWCQKWGPTSPVALGDPRCAGAAAGAASSHVCLGEADAMPARRLAAQEWYKREGIDPTGKATAARRSKLLTNPPQPQRRAGAIYTLPPGVLPDGL